MWKVRELHEKVTNYVMNFTEAEAAMREATNNEPWGPTGTILKELAQYTLNISQFSQIMPLLWKQMFRDEHKSWRRVYKSLLVLNYLIHNGSDRVVTSAREHIYDLKHLQHYQYIDRGKDEGLNVRKKAREIVELIQDDDMLRDVRFKARKSASKLSSSLSYDSSIGIIKKTEELSFEDMIGRFKSEERVRTPSPTEVKFEAAFESDDDNLIHALKCTSAVLDSTKEEIEVETIKSDPGVDNSNNLLIDFNEQETNNSITKQYSSDELWPNAPLASPQNSSNDFISESWPKTEPDATNQHQWIPNDLFAPPANNLFSSDSSCFSSNISDLPSSVSSNPSYPKASNFISNNLISDMVITPISTSDNISKMSSGDYSHPVIDSNGTNTDKPVKTLWSNTGVNIDIDQLFGVKKQTPLTLNELMAKNSATSN